jgi:hypothetical protein
MPLLGVLLSHVFNVSELDVLSENIELAPWVWQGAILFQYYAEIQTGFPDFFPVFCLEQHQFLRFIN